MDIRAEVIQELTEMRNVGISVPDEAFEHAKNLKHNDYPTMKISDIADLMIDLS